MISPELARQYDDDGIPHLRLIVRGLSEEAASTVEAGVDEEYIPDDEDEAEVIDLQVYRQDHAARFQSLGLDPEVLNPMTRKMESTADHLRPGNYYAQNLPAQVPFDLKQLYLSQAEQWPLLTPAQEVELANKRDCGDNTAVNTLVESNLRLVASLAFKFDAVGIEKLDLIQEGNLYLIRAAELFDPKKGARFSTYARWWIRRGIMNSLDDQTQVVRFPRQTHNQIRQIRKAELSIYQRTGIHPTAEEIAEESFLPEDKVKELMAAEYNQRYPLSIDQTVQDDTTALSNFVPNGETPTEEEATEMIFTDEVNQALETINPANREVLERLLGLGGQEPQTHDQVAEAMGVHRSRIGQRREAGLKELRIALGIEQAKPRHNDDETEVVSEQTESRTLINGEEVMLSVEESAAFDLISNGAQNKEVRKALGIETARFGEIMKGLYDKLGVPGKKDALILIAGDNLDERGFTPNEAFVYDAISKGLSFGEAGRIMGTPRSNITLWAKSLYNKLGVKDRNEAIALITQIAQAT